MIGRVAQSLSADEARRAILAAQGFAAGTTAAAGLDRRRVVATVRRLGLVQVDSVNVLSRAHYLPLFSRLGGYDREALDSASSRSPRLLFEYWGHEASLLPVATQPLLRWRMAQSHPWGGVAETMRTRAELIEPVLQAITALGPVTVSQLERHLEHDEPRPTGEWGWNWSVVKRLVEGLFWEGAISSAGRDAGFRRRYDLTDRVLPAAVRQAPTPERREAMAGLVAIAGRALGVTTLADLRDYFRLPAAETRAAVTDLVTAQVLEPVAVPGWPPAWRHRSARVPRSVEAQALLVPFDPLIWHRERVERVFGMRYRIEIYTPAPKREFGYYVLPFLQGDRLVARVDLRADRRNGELEVKGAWAHNSAETTPAPVTGPAPITAARAPGTGASSHACDPHRLADALRGLARWLDLADVSVTPNGDLAAELAAAVRSV